MTTIEQRNYSQVIPRPTDLSLKSSLNSKYCAQRRLAQYDNQRHVMVRTPPGPTDLFNEQPCATDNVNWSKHSAASPIALVFGGTSLSTVTTTMATTPMLDSAARLVVLDSILSRQSDTRSTSRAIYDLPSKRCRGESESSSDGMPPSSTSPSATHVMTSIEKPSSPKSRSPNATTPVTPTAPRGRGTKRKGGWKFHDLSDESDGLGRRKRAYANSKLENEILLLYQDRICIKDMPSSASGKNTDRLVVIEPNFISDPDLVKYSTGLRLVLNKKRGSFQLQVLPYTIEQGSLSNKSAVMSAVEKMLGDNGSVLCPGIARAILTPQTYLPRQAQEIRFNEQLRFNPNASGQIKAKKDLESLKDGQQDMEHSGGDRYWGRWKVFNQFAAKFDQNYKPSAKESFHDDKMTTPITPTDRLLLSLNKELSQNQHRQTAQASMENGVTANRCLLWHVPTTGGKGNKALWPTDAKWCANCWRKMNGSK